MFPITLAIMKLAVTIGCFGAETKSFASMPDRWTYQKRCMYKTLWVKNKRFPLSTESTIDGGINLWKCSLGHTSTLQGQGQNTLNFPSSSTGHCESREWPWPQWDDPIQ